VIITGQSRSDWHKCAKRIMREGKNESARLVEVVGFAADNVADCFMEMRHMVVSTQCANFFYHASINPRAHELLSELQWEQAVHVLGRALGLEECSRFVVERVQNGRIHRQVVWLRIGAGLKAVPDAWSYAKQQSAARELEALFGHEPTSRRRVRNKTAEAAP
jgi:hypothetical protein